MAEKDISAAELNWLDEFLKYEARELIGASELAGKAALGLSKALGGQARPKDVEDLLSLVPQSVDEAAKKAVDEQAPKPVEISDEIYDELAQALAADLVKAVEDGEQQLIELLLNDEDGLWAQVRKEIIEELQTQDLSELSPETIGEALNSYAQDSLDAALDGLWEGIAEAGGYLWLLSPSD